MDNVYGCCCGIDVHKNMLAVCVLKGRKKETKEFGTITTELLDMTDWLQSEGVEEVAMESTGPYWKPVYNILEAAGIPVMIVNAAHMKNVPGRKTDVKDAEWIADLLKHGLLKASFIPDRDHRELRDALTYRKKLVEDKANEINRIQKIFEGANIKLGSYISDITGMSGLCLMEELVNTETPISISRIKQLRDNGEIAKNLKATPEELVEAMNGCLSPAQKVMIQEMLKRIRQTNAAITVIEDLIGSFFTPEERGAIGLLKTIPGIDDTGARTIVGIIGTDMSRFPTADKLCAWAGVAPGDNKSANKRKREKCRKGNKLLKTTLVVCANAAVKKKDTFLSSKFKSLVARLGYQKAIMAIAHSMLKIIWKMLQTGEVYTDLGPDYYETQRKEHTINSCLKKLAKCGWTPGTAIPQSA